LLAGTHSHPALGGAFYQQAELCRLRGEFADAEKSYRQASQFGHVAQPGLSLLRLAQGELETASAAIRRLLAETQDKANRPKVLAAGAEIMLAKGDVAAARAAADELSRMADDFGAPMLSAHASYALGAVHLAEGDVSAAVPALRRAWAEWQDLDVPYEAARSRVLLALAYRSLGDSDTAAIELDAAQWAFRKLGATPDVARTKALLGAGPDSASGLTAREVEVLRLIAAGKSNRSIANDLVVSERTIDRHVSNILTKLGVPSRAAATAYAYEHGLV
jgi:ATP/maltotriose-dependent transcriptional regulator MalT